MASIFVDVPENAGLLTSSGELFHPDPKLQAEIRFKTVTATEILPGYRDCSANEQMIQIEHIVTDTRGRRFVFTSFLSPYFFWDQMFLATIVGCSPEYIEYGNLLDGYAHERKTLVENVGFYRDGRQRRALRCYFPPTADDPENWSERIFPIWEKHISARLNLTGIQWKETNMGVHFIVELHDLRSWEDTNGKEYGGNETDKFCYRFMPYEILWRHFEKPVVQKYGKPEESFDGVSFEPISPLNPITFVQSDKPGF
ncbi:MAG TPA: hypothetical protein VHG71_07895 [Verrucomicrobiae bacterium]|nr:hypothetical protein [Verrucomicrobiae bacterium]